MNSELMSQIEAVGSRLKKKELLARADQSTRDALVLALDPMVTFGITTDETLDRSESGYASTSKWTQDEWWAELRLILLRLAERELTGNEATSTFERHLCAAHSLEDVKWACRIVNKNLRAGFGISTLNEVFPDSIDKFEVQLAEPYDPAKHDLKGQFIEEPKLDGLRMVVIKGVPYTRNGHIITSVDHIVKELGDQLFDEGQPGSGLEEWVFDGELMGAGEFDEISGNVRRGGGESVDLYLNAFDLVHFDEWDDPKTPLSERKENLKGIIDWENAFNVKMVPWTPLGTNPTFEQIEAGRAHFASLGFEGGMVKDLAAPYKKKRSDTVLKFKKMLDADGRIVATYEGKGRLKGMLGGITVEVDGVQTNVGSGFDDVTRRGLWEGRENIIGKMVEIKYQNLTKDKKMRFPIFIKFRPDKD